MREGKRAEYQAMKFIKLDLKIKPETLKKDDGTEWTSQELIDLLKKKTFGRVPSLLKDKPEHLLAKCGTSHILDRGYKVDFLMYSPKIGGYLGIDFLLYPQDEDWTKLQSKIQEIEELRQSGLYEAINVKRVGVMLVKPAGPNDVVEDDRVEEEEDCLFRFLGEMEEAEFMPKTGILDLREEKEWLPEPPM